MTFLWTDERIEALKALWRDGLSASQVAAEFGHGLTRNAVIGKLHRLGMNAADRTAAAPRKGPVPRAITGRPARRAASIRSKTHEQREQAVAELRDAIANQGRVRDHIATDTSMCALIDLEAHSCRWPVGDPLDDAFRFCGLDKGDNPNTPYCGEHMRVAYTGPPVRQRAVSYGYAPRFGKERAI